MSHFCALPLISFQLELRAPDNFTVALILHVYKLVFYLCGQGYQGASDVELFAPVDGLFNVAGITSGQTAHNYEHLEKM